MNIQDIQPGMRVTWVHTPKSGVPDVLYVLGCKVHRVWAKRVTIEAPLAAGGTRRVTVSPTRLNSSAAPS